MSAERRRWPRRPLETDLALTMTADGWSRPCRIVEFGLGGAEVHLDGSVPRNLEVRIEHLTAGYLYATRAWAAPGVMGIAFDNPDRARDFLALCGTHLPLLQSARA